MKNILLIAILFLLIFSCKKEESVVSKAIPPVVKTNSSSEIASSTAKIWGEVVEEGSSAANERGFVYSEKNPSPSTSDNKVVSGFGKGEFNALISSLIPKTKYYFKAYANNQSGIAYGDAKDFTTLDGMNLPTLVTNQISNITFSGCTIGGNITSDGGGIILEKGIVYSTSANPTILNNKLVSSNSANSYTLVLGGLTDNTTYYIRAFATNSKGTNYGDQQVLTTLKNLTSIIKNGLVAYYPFNGNADDVSGSGINGINNGATLTYDRYNNNNSAYNFSNKGVIRTNKAISNVSNNFTISVWATTKTPAPVKIQGFSSGNNGDVDGPPIVHPAHGSTWDSQSAGVGLIFGTNQIQIIEHAAGYIFYPLVYSGNFSGWNHIVLNYENHIPKLYLNGKLVATGIASSMPSIRPSNGFDSYPEYSESGFGKSFYPSVAFNSTRQYDGIIDDYAIWNRALNLEEIKFLFENDFKP